MQYTGLKDKNGKEIYEGDVILRDGFGSSVGPVEYHLSSFVMRSTVSGHFHGLDFGELEVIGNIYENPELMTK